MTLITTIFGAIVVYLILLLEQHLPGELPSWARLAVKLFACYLVVVGLVCSLENTMLYLPTPAHDGWLPPPAGTVQDVELSSADGNRIHAWWCPRQGARGAVLYCHGNAGNLSCRRDAIADMRDQLGLSVLIFDYPGYGRSEGKPTEASCHAAANAAYEWLTGTQGISPEDVVIFGKSLGGGVAADMASRREHGALVLIKTFTSAPELAQKLFPWLPARWLMRNRFDIRANLARCRRPVFIAQSTHDGLMPFSHGERLFSAAHEPKCFFVLTHHDHNDLLPTEFYTALGEFLRKECRVEHGLCKK